MCYETILSPSLKAEGDPTTHGIIGSPAVLFTCVGTPGTKNLTMIVGGSPRSSPRADITLNGAILGLTFTATNQINGSTMMVVVKAVKDS